MRIVAPTILLVASALSGCYRYVPTTRDALAPGAAVSVDLTLQGSINAAPQIGSNVANLEGTVSDADSSGAITLALASVRRRGENLASTWNGETIRLSSLDIAEIKGKQLSRGRTVAAWTALGAASVGLIVGIAKATDLVGGSGGGRPIPTPTGEPTRATTDSGRRPRWQSRQGAGTRESV